ncbi:MAG: hypothetical protein H6917_01555 [Novosphingobium sp.]|nr:hypothetical protein [Novosphingobium sp.]MCP5401056.1 hypothetical protein [Novosphingobium sp.]
MIARLAVGWEIMLADLSLILFMVTAVTLSQTEDGAGGVAVSPQGEALAFYQAEPGAPPIGEWLEFQSPDARQQLTIVAQYRPGGQAAAIAMAEKLAREARAAGAQARIVVEPGEGGITATLAYDVPSATLARGLHQAGQDQGTQKDRP